MKKALIAGAASAVLAAMPVVGVFAEQTQGTGSVTDIVTFTLADSCTLSATNDGGTYTITDISANQTKTIDGSAMTIKCNNTAGWALKAVGTGDDATNKTAMNASAAGTDIITATSSTSSGASYWALHLSNYAANGYGTTAGDTSEDQYGVIPTAATTVASNSTPTNMGTGVTVTPTYQVFVSNAQEADTYTGKVTYTVYYPQN